MTTFPTTYDEYLWLRKQYGYADEHALARHVWERCDPDAQEDMLEQLRGPIRRLRAKLQEHQNYGNW